MLRKTLDVCDAGDYFLDLLATLSPSSCITWMDERRSMEHACFDRLRGKEQSWT